MLEELAILKSPASELKNVEKNMEQTVQAFTSCYLGLGMCNYVPYVELTFLVDVVDGP